MPVHHLQGWSKHLQDQAGFYGQIQFKKAILNPYVLNSCFRHFPSMAQQLVQLQLLEQLSAAPLMEPQLEIAPRIPSALQDWQDPVGLPVPPYVATTQDSIVLNKLNTKVLPNTFEFE